MITLLSLQVGQVQVLEYAAARNQHERTWATAFWKQPVTGNVALEWLGLNGDSVADWDNHSGRDKAVCCYASDHYPKWRELLAQEEVVPRDFPFDEFAGGAFGENFSLAGLNGNSVNEETVCIGDVFEIGTARVQVSQPRQPCWKLGRRWQLKELPGWTIERGWTGWYLRVLQPGIVAAGQEMKLLERRQPDWTIAQANQVLYFEKKNLPRTQALSLVPELSESWRETLEARANMLEHAERG